MKLNTLLIAIGMLLSHSKGIAQIKNSSTTTAKISGNCGMCEKTIEKAGNLKKIAMVDWDKNSKMATITYNPRKTNTDEILKRIALAGYDNEKYLAPDNAYANLSGCCQYDRIVKTGNASQASKTEVIMVQEPETTKQDQVVAKQDNFKAIFDTYFTLKDALVKSDGVAASAKAGELLVAVKAIKMEQLSNAEHMAWMKVKKELEMDAEHISETKDVGHQRDHFITLSENLYILIKASKYQGSIYYQHCPMANKGKGANWLSKETAISNPYFGSKMLTCGKTVDTF